MGRGRIDPFVRMDVALLSGSHCGMSNEVRRPRRRLPVLLAVLLSLGLLPNGAILAGSPLARAAVASPATQAAPSPTAVDPGIQPFVRQARPLNREVFGYLPYWRLDVDTAGELRYELLSSIAFFGLGIKADGSLDTAWRGYTAYLSDNAVAVTNAAHAAGVRVMPTFQLFDSGSLTRMTTFLNSATAQSRFIGEALDLMARRSADGASLDFEPVPASVQDAYAAFVGRFHSAMRAWFPGAILVNATSAGASNILIGALVPNVEQLFVMTYNYRWSGSTAAGPIAPLDNTTRTVKKHIARFLTVAPASKLLLGEGLYGYDWPVTGSGPYATVQANRGLYGDVWSVSYRYARDWLASHPGVTLHEDTVQGSGWYSYWDGQYKTCREVYFEDAQSLVAKDDFAIASGLAGIGIWTLGNDRGYSDLWNVIQAKFYAPVHSIAVQGSVTGVTLRRGYVYADVWRRIRNSGNVPESGRMVWTIRDRYGRARVHANLAVTIYPGRKTGYVTRGALLGRASLLPAGRYSVTVTFTTRTQTWRSPTSTFRQPY